MKKRLISLLLAIVMVLGLIPATTLTAFAAAANSVLVGGVEMTNGTYLANGATTTQTTKPSGGYAYYKNGTLTLNNYSYEGKGYSYVDNKIDRNAIIYASNDIQIELVGTNNLTQKSYTNTACICGEAEVSLTGAGTLNLQNAVWGITCKSDLSIESGNLNVDACDLGVYSRDQKVIINGGSLKIDATKCAVDGYAGIEINGGSGIFRNTQDSVYRVLHSGNGGSGPVTMDPSLVVRASTTADGQLSEYVAANLASYKKIVITPSAFTTQPTGGTVGYNQRHIADWVTNFIPVKQELVRYSSAGNVVQIQALNAGAYQASLSYLTDGYYYRIRAYYDSTSYIESDKIYVTPDQYFTPNNQHSNTDGDIIKGITYVPNGDGTFNANVHVDLNYVDGQMLQYYWASTGYYWYDHNNKLTSGIGTTDTSKLVFTLYNLGKNLVPGKAWKVKVYLADDPYADYEWRDVDFHYVTDTVPELKPEDAFTNPFTDVKEGDFYYAPVLWAVENGITAGTTPTTFDPNGKCLRAHVVTFLHRAAGSPNPTSTRNPFTDVKSTDFFYKPVLWAVEKSITSGTSATTFGSMQNCNRAAVVTFLWRAAGSPEPKSTKNPFVDVKSTDFFYKPVLWAVENGITAGLDATHFGPTPACNRAQVVTFLYRAYN